MLVYSISATHSLHIVKYIYIFFGLNLDLCVLIRIRFHSDHDWKVIVTCYMLQEIKIYCVYGLIINFVRAVTFFIRAN